MKSIPLRRALVAALIGLFLGALITEVPFLFLRTYIKEESTAAQEESGKYVCNVCGYVYDPAAGDPDNGVQPGTRFEDVPDSWVCPVCGAPKANSRRNK